MRLRVMHSLPDRHQLYVARIVRERCTEYLKKNGASVTGGELLSRLWEKFLSGGFTPAQGDLKVDEGRQHTPEALAVLSRPNWNDGDPDRDIRVTWLLNELDAICSTTALHNLCIDIIREQQGSKVARTIPIEFCGAETLETLRQPPNQARRIHEQHVELAWKGLLALRMRECSDPDDDVLLLIRVLAGNPEIEANFTTQWPIKAIVLFMNASDHRRAWDQRSVDNVKEKLARWISKKEI